MPAHPFDTAMGSGGVSQEDEVMVDHGTHRYAIALPERSAALDVGEEEGDGTGGEIGHGPFQMISWM